MSQHVRPSNCSNKMAGCMNAASIAAESRQLCAQKKKSLWAGEDLVWRWICRETHAFCKLAAAMLPLNFFDLDLVLDLQSERIARRTHSSTRHCLLDGVAVSACTCAH